MIQFIAGAIFGAVFGFILVALMTVAKKRIRDDSKGIFKTVRGS